MADQAPEVFVLPVKAGVQRDGTSYDSDYYQDVQWVRFQRSRPKKMGGYRAVTGVVSGPVRSLIVDSRQGVNSVHTFSKQGVQRLQIDANGSGGAIYDRTPAGFATGTDYTWSTSLMFSSTGGSYTALLAAATPDLGDIGSDVAGPVYSGDVTGTGALVPVSETIAAVVTPITTSGGCVVLQPFLFVYGSNGLIRNSNANDFSAATGWVTGGSNLANSANPSGTKIVKGLPMRGGTSSPSGLFWSLDSLIRVVFVGGTSIFRYDTVSASISVLSKSGIIEYDGLYFWAGVDRFFVYNGVVQELPNQLNSNYFFDNLNFAQRQKVWAMKVPRYGEIWWFYPRGSAVECTDVIIYNVRDNVWYDNRLARTAGYSSQVFQFPVMAGGEDTMQSTFVTFGSAVGFFKVGDVVTSTGGATGVVVKASTTSLNIVNQSALFLNGDVITNNNGTTATINSAPVMQQLDSIWQHEIGHDKVSGQVTSAIRSYFETTNFSYQTGGPTLGGQSGMNYQSRLVRVEPDFIQGGTMSLFIMGQKYANSPVVTSVPYLFDSTTEHLDLREQRRLLALRFESNVIGGYYEGGKILIAVEPGDVHA